MQGLIFGAGFAVAFLAVSLVALYFVLPAIIRGELVVLPDAEEVHAPPDVGQPDRFLGTGGVYMGKFDHGSGRVLSAGPGRIIGVVTVDGEPLEGLRLRLALKGSVMSQWTTSGPDGRYEIDVPYGQYRIDGFDLDTDSANSVLPGKIGHPRNGHSSGTFDVTEDEPRQGLNLKFIDPVVLDMPKHRFSAGENVVVRWKPYPGARKYSIQLYEREDPHA